VTEAEWDACTDSQKMLTFLRGKASDRKLRLFAVACCHFIGAYLREEEWAAVRVAEQYADGLVGADALAGIPRMVDYPPDPDGAFHMWSSTAWTLGEAVLAAIAAPAQPEQAARGSARRQIGQAQLAGVDWPGYASDSQCRCLRDLFGPLPFRPLPGVSPAWLAWEGGTVPRLAAAVYEERAFDRLPILADALEEAGCTDADILGHLRRPGPHVRGCWVLDLLLGKT
jgi:hypothetical protein